MSGGTMIALSGQEIWMGTHSNLGPIDPQFGMQPFQLFISEFKRAYDEIDENPNKLHVWRPILEQTPPTFLSIAEHAVAWSKEIGKSALIGSMFKDDPCGEQKADKIIEFLTNEQGIRNHARHLHREECKNAGLNIVEFESDQYMQDLILSIHHSCMVSLANTPMIKIIENHNGISYIKEQA